jgi:hypothetical protein
MKMSKFDQYIFIGLLIPPLILCLLGDYHSARIMALPPIIVFLLWVYADKIRANKKLMEFLDKVF